MGFNESDRVVHPSECAERTERLTPNTAVVEKVVRVLIINRHRLNVMIDHCQRDISPERERR